jgi:hypothetical protein
LAEKIAPRMDSDKRSAGQEALQNQIGDFSRGFALPKQVKIMPAALAGCPMASFFGCFVTTELRVGAVCDSAGFAVGGRTAILCEGARVTGPGSVASARPATSFGLRSSAPKRVIGANGED